METGLNNRFILLVEDNENDVVLTERAFKKCHISEQLIVSWDGVDALDFLFCRNGYADRNPHHQPALVLLDLKLPRVNGFEVLKQIRSDKRTTGLPVIVLTSSMEEKDRTECDILGANEYLRKPIEFNTFLEMIRQLKSRWLDNGQKALVYN